MVGALASPVERRVLTARRGQLRYALPLNGIGRATPIRRSAALPRTAPWFAGVGAIADALVWLVDVPSGAVDEEPLVLLEAGEPPAWALCIDRVEGLGSVADVHTGDDVDLLGWPSGWARGVRLADGGNAVLIDPTAIARDLQCTAEVAR